MEEGLLVKEKEERKGWGLVWKETKRVGYVAGPMVAVTLSQFLLQVIPLSMVGHLTQLSLSSSSVAMSLAAVTGFTLLVCQDPQISHEAGKFMTWLTPSLFGYATLQPLIRYYQMQSLIFPMLACSFITICFHVLMCWLLVFKSGLDNLGAAVAMGLSMWLNAIMLCLYMKYSSKCEKTRTRISLKVFQGTGEFFRLAIPSAAMLCVEWWSFELLILLSGLLPNPQLEISVLSVCTNTINALYAIPSGLAAATSTIISNELGAGRPERARASVIASTLLAIINATVVGMSLFVSRRVFGYVFSNENEIVDYVTDMAPLICLSVVIDNIQGALLGVARACGWQHIGAYINLAAFYAFGIPVAAALAFWFGLGGKGLWIGILSGSTLQAIMLAAAKARERLSQEKSLS
ncbi:protein DETOXIFICATION 12 [Sesamum angolense]|uniref:Protein DETOXIFICATION 12 n=1 Tax=Sesamum angolense TaxID=2727404 RepID=A0AAE2BWG3_9LAMI|nr:protein DETOXIFICATION 12 [Sesamum angolense]